MRRRGAARQVEDDGGGGVLECVRGRREDVAGVEEDGGAAFGRGCSLGCGGFLAPRRRRRSAALGCEDYFGDGV